jgi:hypothetical protein
VATTHAEVIETLGAQTREHRDLAVLDGLRENA